MVLVTNGRLITRDSEGKGYYEHGAVAYEGAKKLWGDLNHRVY